MTNLSRLRAAMGAFACAVAAVTLLQLVLHLAGPAFAQSTPAAAPSGSLDLTNLSIGRAPGGSGC